MRGSCASDDQQTVRKRNTVIRIEHVRRKTSEYAVAVEDSYSRETRMESSECYHNDFCRMKTRWLGTRVVVVVVEWRDGMEQTEAGAICEPAPSCRIKVNFPLTKAEKLGDDAETSTILESVRRSKFKLLGGN